MLKTSSIGVVNYERMITGHYYFSWKNMSRSWILLYGHTHNSVEDTYFQKCVHQMYENGCRHVDDNHVYAYNVGCMKEYMQYTPRSLKEIKEMAE